MSFKAIQNKWYAKIEKDGFKDAEDHEVIGIPLKRWSGSQSISALHNNKIIDLIDQHVHQEPFEDMRSSFPEPMFNIKEDFMNYVEFARACEFICRHSNNRITPRIVKKIWEMHCEGETVRVIAKNIKYSHNIHYTKVHRVITKLTEWMNTMNSNTEELPTYEEEPIEDKKIKVTIRPYNHDTDAAFVYSSWRHALWYDNNERDDANANEFYKKANREIRKLINQKTTKIKVACFQDDKDEIVGYSVMSGDNIEWVYIKLGSRNSRVATLLCKGFKTISEPMTKLGMLIAEKKNLKEK